MNADSHPDMLRRHESPDEPITAHPHSHQQINKFNFLPKRNDVALTCAIVALVIAAILVLGMFGLYNRYFVLKMNYDDLKAAMLLHGIEPHPHLPTEEP